jgi:site-specific recombinase XerD
MKSDYVRKDGTCSLYAQVQVKGVTVKLPVDITLEPIFWDNRHEQVKEFHPNADELNMMLEQVKANIFEVRKRYMLMQKDLTPDLLRQEYGNHADEDFLKWISREMDLRRHEVADGTYAKYRSTLAKLREFKPQLMFSDITPETISQFQSFCRRKGNNITTTNKALRIIKIFTSIAVRRELLKNDPFDHIRLKKGSPTLIYLSTEERDKLVKMFQSDYTYEKYKRVLHYFLFACFTGLRISDIKLLRWENIANDTIYIMPFKTRRVNQETVIIPLGAKAKWLLSLIPKRPRNPYVFDVISEQKTNVYLKEIADLVGINKRVYFHVARHTFATLFYERTNDLATLQKLLGHSSIAQTMVYAHVSDQLRREQMKQFDND